MINSDDPTPNDSVTYELDLRLISIQNLADYIKFTIHYFLMAPTIIFALLLYIHFIEILLFNFTVILLIIFFLLVVLFSGAFVLHILITVFSEFPGMGGKLKPNPPH